MKDHKRGQTVYGLGIGADKMETKNRRFCGLEEIVCDYKNVNSNRGRYKAL
jgi:hypothetical protein